MAADAGSAEARMTGADDWFAVDALRPGVWQIAEPGHVASFLVAGDERAALIDTGMGVRPIRPVVEALTDKPVIVVNSHHHMDHVGGNHEFDEIAIHESGAERLAAGASLEIMPAYVEYARAAWAAFSAYERADRQFFHQLTDARRLRPLPPGFSADGWSIAPTQATELLRDGDAIELGGRALRVIHAPGHSSDGIVLDLVGEGILFGGDTVNTGAVYLQTPDSDAAVFADVMDSLAARADSWELVTCCHWLVTLVGPEMLRAQARAARAVCDGDVQYFAADDCLGNTVREARFDGFSFLLPA
jgi:glyoxylase-like metal-dependent hydrolase (beta-lactamase superfamily II)